ncbi:MAG: 4-(cytidine 5'-diphospho)-2-C-methyl-D-erythritol kinase [Cyanobacteria bacterium]|nr:4-(cytidine 5'-diphospho)-2-C-methyl-D-erythritol kinase [Cyanobacteriota bacterium]MDA1020983.1 4-(cytidine 5'-diphospho)-2-C-methyl-D-erythritol kinase [Cyanobacteriota bacterium]
MVLSKKAVYLERAPAKINLFLDVTDKRDDEYHNIKTVFQAINLEDHLTFEITLSCAENDEERTEEIEFVLEIDSNDEAIRALGLSNLVSRAVECYFANFPGEDTADLLDLVSSINLSIFIDKRIPMQAGLGGASADAAATLRALNIFFLENFDCSLSEKELLGIALQLGSDVPFCLHSIKQTRVYAESRGEDFKELPKTFDFDKYNELILVKPSFGIETAEAYKLINPTIKAKADNTKLGFYNAFETVIFDNYPELVEIKLQLLKIGCDQVLLSGSGSTMLGFINKEKNLKTIHGLAKETLPDCSVYHAEFIKRVVT